MLRVRRVLCEGLDSVIGLDVSLTDTGVAVFRKTAEPDVCSVHLVDDIKTDKNQPDEFRGDMIHDRVVALIRHEVQDGRHPVVFLEGYALGMRTGKIFTRSEIIGTIKRTLRLYTRTPVYLVAPTALKKFVTGKGNADKKSVMSAVRERWGYDTKNDNRADAYSLGRYGIAVLWQGRDDLKTE